MNIQTEEAYAAAMRKSAQSSRKPKTARNQVVDLMSDGRERTTSDVARALGKRDPGPTSVTLHRMARKGLLARDMLLGVAIWRKV